MIITPVKKIERDELAQMCITTFTSSFAHMNTKANMEDYLSKAFNLQTIGSELTNPKSYFSWAVQNEIKAGYIKLNIEHAQTEQFDQDAMEIQRIYLLQKFQKKGMGRTLIDYAIQQGKILKRSQIWLGVWERNINSIAFYEKMGFKIFDSHDFPFGDEVQTDLLMKRSIY